MKRKHVKMIIKKYPIKLIILRKELLNTKEVSNYQFERNRTQRELNTISEEMNSVLKRIQTLNNDYRRKTLIYMLYQKYNLNDFKGKEAEKLYQTWRSMQ